MQDAVIVSATRTAVGKAPNGALKTVRPDEMAAAVIAEALRRAPGIEPSDIEDVILGCAMPEAEQGLNVARIASLRAGVPVSASAVTDQPLLLVRPAGDRVRRRAHHVRLRQHRHRRRHRIDEHGADGWQQDLAEPRARRQLPGRLSEHRSRRRKPRARKQDLARRAGCVCAAQSSARDRGHRCRPVRRRNHAAHLSRRRPGERQRNARRPRADVRRSTKGRGAILQRRHSPRCGPHSMQPAR